MPGHLHALNDEVADIEAVLNHLASVFKECASTVSSRDQEAVQRLLDQAQSKLAELQTSVDQLTSYCRSSKSTILQAQAFRREKPRFRELQEEVRTIKTSLNVAIGASNSEDMLRIRLDLQNLSAITSQAAAANTERQLDVRDEIIRSLEIHQDDVQTSVQEVCGQVDQRIAKVEEMLQAQVYRGPHSGVTQQEPVYRVRPPNRRRPSPPQLPPRSEGVRVHLNQYTATCSISCQCQCHQNQQMATPRFVDRVLGQMFVGYAGLPFLNAKCNDGACAKAQTARVSVEYWFPLGFCWSQIVRLQLGYQPNVGPQMALSTLRRIPDSAAAVTHALNGNIDGLKDLFARGLASPRDVSDTRGYSILRWALYGKKYETCKFLVHAGADPDYRPISKYDNSPKNKAWDFILQGGLSREIVDLLSCLTEGSDFVEEQNYTKAHKIVLGLSMSSLEEEIAQHPDAIDCVDALGRTPLIWAAARGNEAAVVLLLGAGADPNAVDNQYTSAVSYAAERDQVICVRLLLEAGAEPDPIFDDGTKVGSPLNCSARNATNPLILKTLLDFGADIEASGVEGITPLIHVARTNKYHFALLLLEYGADLNATTTLGQTPLTTAIAYNSHGVLQLLLDRWIEFSVCPRLKSLHLLEITALYANLETIRTLVATDHINLSYDRAFTVGDFVAQIRQRADGDEKLVRAFEELVGIIDREPRSKLRRVHDTEMAVSKKLDSVHLDAVNEADNGSEKSEDSEAVFNDAIEQL